MAGSRLPERGPLWRPQVVPLVVALTALAGGVALQSSVVVAAQESGQLFRCETEEDLDGSACRVDMLPDAALAEMVYERGFDPEGADRLQLLDAVVQLLDYESATGEDLREMVYIPDDDGSAAAAAADAELEAAANAAATAAALAADEAAAAAEAKAEAAAQAEVGEAAAAAARGGAAGTLSGDSGCAATNEHEHFDEGGASGEAEALPSSGSAAAATAAATAEAEQQALREVIEESSFSSSSSSSGGGGEGEGWGAEGQPGGLVEQGSVVGYARGLLGEVLQTMKRDLNAVVGFLPAPVAKPIREVAAVASDTAVRFVAPALRQAERYTRGLRREAGHAAGRAALRLKNDVGPWIARGIASGFGKAKRRLGEAVEKRRGRVEGGEGEEEGRGGVREGQKQ